MYEGAVQDLIDELGRLPGVGPKSAQRIAFHLLAADPTDVRRLVHALTEVKDKDARGLRAYLCKALASRRNGWVTALNTLFAGADAKRYDDWTAVQLFAHHCYHAKKKGEPDAMIETLALAGTVRWYVPCASSST